MRIRTLAAALAALLTLGIGPVPADAAQANTFYFTGSGTVAPGFGETPHPQSFDFTGTATVEGTAGILPTRIRVLSAAGPSARWPAALAGWPGPAALSCSSPATWS